MATKENMKCNSPVPSNRAGKKKMVKACSNGTEKLLHFGAKGYGNNYSAAARKSFRARHSCDTANDKLTPRYWACKNLWAGPGGSTTSNPSNRRGNYTFLSNFLEEYLGIKDDVFYLSLFENQGSIFKSDFVGEYYDNETQDLTFWWEEDNNHWI
jgi:hypothetical protein